MSFTSNYTDRIKKLPPYLFVEIDRMKNKCLAKGKDIIDLGIGDPDIPTPSVIVEAMKFAVENPAHHKYPSTAGMMSFRETAVNWFKKKVRGIFRSGNGRCEPDRFKRRDRARTYGFYQPRRCGSDS